MLAPPRPPAHDELEALIREARARRRKRLLGTAAVVALVAGGAVAVYAIVTGGSSNAARAGRAATLVESTKRCGIRVAGPRILGSGGSTAYREPIPGHFTHPNRVGSQVRCSTSEIWVVFFNGVAASQEGYFGVRSANGGRTWRAVFTERFFGLKAPHQLDDYFGPWTLRGPRSAYFIGECPACGWGTVALWVTKDGGHTFRRYDVPALTGYGPTRIRVSGNAVTISGRRVERKVNSRSDEIYGHKTVTIRVV